MKGVLANKSETMIRALYEGPVQQNWTIAP